MLTEDKFFEKAQEFALYPTVDGTYFTYDELSEKIKDLQTDKDDKTVILYASDKEEQHSYIEAAKEKGLRSIVIGFANYCSPHAKNGKREGENFIHTCG